MARGRKPSPTKLKLVKGNPGKRPLNDAEPEPPVVEVIPDPPEWMGKHGQQKWTEAAQVLIGMNVLTAADLTTLELYCASYDRLREAQEIIDKDGLVVEREAAHGGVSYAKHPAVLIVEKSTTELRSYASELGLTPASRTKVRQASTPPGGFDPMGEDF